ncbi:MAG: polysaccharide deacetylase, partial [Candidatus Saccharibacteria bacterium]|nr:polysaccharide deacetylase [Rhodoferax sp.]
MNKKIAITAAALASALILGAAIYFALAQKDPAPTQPVGAGTVANTLESKPLIANLQSVLAAYRKIIVLFADEKTLTVNERTLANQVGQSLFHENRQRVVDLESSLGALVGNASPARFEALGSVLDYIESGAGLFDADRLAFREILRSLQLQVTADSSLPAIKLHKRMGEDLEALAEIERNYEKEIRLVFGRFETRAIDLKRERWDDYLASLKKLYNREQILKDFGVVLPYPAPKDSPAASKNKTKNEDEGEVFGHSLPA